jgi:methylmalonyl-CoA mutase
VLSIDNEEVRSSQLERLKRVRAARNEADVAAALQAMTDLAAKLGEGVDPAKADQNLVNFGFFVLVLEKSAPSFVVNLIRLINL